MPPLQDLAVRRSPASVRPTIAGKTRKVKQPLSAAPPIDPGFELGRGFAIPICD